MRIIIKMEKMRMWKVKGVLSIVLVVLLMTLMFFVVPVTASDGVFSWEPNTEPDLVGYKIHYGEQEGVYTTIVDAGLPDTVDGRVMYTVRGIPEGMTHYAATAYDEDGESDYSNSVSFNPVPSPPVGLGIRKIIITIGVHQ